MRTDLGTRRAGARRTGQSGGRGLLVRVGVASVAAGSAGLTVVISLCAWMVHGGEPADVGSRAASGGLSVFGTIHPQLLSYGAASLQTDIPHAPPMRLARLESTFEARFALAATDNPSNAPATTAAVPSFNQRFSFSHSASPTRSLQPSMPFADRFAGVIASGAAPVQFAMVDPRLTVPPVAPAVAPAPAAAAPAPHAGARALAARVAPKRTPAPYRVASASDTPLPTAYASVDSATKDSAIDDLLKKMTARDAAPRDADAKDSAPKDASPPASDTSRTAIYDISAHTVYLPNGERLEAHSGLGEHMDDVRYVNLRSLGPTPPNVYELKMRESTFHGVQAIRLNPVDNGKMYGRDGILAHPFMLGPNGQSNGCVSVKDYPAFLAAYQRGEINRLVVVERLDDPPGGARTAAGWIADKLKGIFGRS